MQQKFLRDALTDKAAFELSRRRWPLRLDGVNLEIVGHAPTRMEDEEP